MALSPWAGQALNCSHLRARPAGRPPAPWPSLSVGRWLGGTCVVREHLCAYGGVACLVVGAAGGPTDGQARHSEQPWPTDQPWPIWQTPQPWMHSQFLFSSVPVGLGAVE